MSLNKGKKDSNVIPSFLNDALGFNIYRTGLLFRRELMHALSDWKMTPEQWMIMASLWSTGKPVSQSEIVQMTLQDKHTVSRIIQRLVRDGWVEKKSADRDGRITMIFVTRKGQSLRRRMQEKMNLHFVRIIEGFKEGEELVRLLKKMRYILGD